MPAQSLLFRRLFDDASLFPPASLPMAKAVEDHLRHRQAWYGEMSGPFVCADGRINQLSAALIAANTAELDLALVLPGGAETLGTGTDAVFAEPRLRLRALEIPIAPLGAAGDGAAAVAALAGAIDQTPLASAMAFLEIPVRAVTADAVQVVADHRYLVKLRTGGVTADAFPDEADLAQALTALADAHLPFKCTAGLHHAVRQRADDTGFEHHGFLNVLLATAAALDGEASADVASILADHDGDAVAARIAGLDPEGCADIRGLFTSFGTCSTEEPVTDLVTLGLVSKD